MRKTIESIRSQCRVGKSKDLALIHTEEFQDCFDEDSILVHEGDLSVDGDFDFSEGVLFVLGSVTILGTLSSDETGTMLVTHALKARNLFAEGNLEVQGDTDITEVTFGFYEAGITSLEGTTRGKVLIAGCHSFEIENPTFEHTFEFDNFSGLATGSKEDLEGLLTKTGFEVVSKVVFGSDDDDDERYWSPKFLCEGILRC